MSCGNAGCQCVFQILSMYMISQWALGVQDRMKMVGRLFWIWIFNMIRIKIARVRVSAL